MAHPTHSIGLLVIGHGTRSDQGRQYFWSTVNHVTEELPGTVVVGGFLEHHTPDIPMALQALARQGLSEVVLAPLLLCSAGHAERDIPAAARRGAAAVQLPVRQLDVLGCHPRILALSATRFRTALGPHDDPDNVLWLCVARGSSHASATAEMHRFVALRRTLTPVGTAALAFLNKAEPRVETVVSEIAASHYTTVIVQPHLLYPGRLLSRLHQLVTRQDRVHRRQRWILTDCLGCDRAIAQVVAERFRAVAPA